MTRQTTTYRTAESVSVAGGAGGGTPSSNARRRRFGPRSRVLFWQILGVVVGAVIWQVYALTAQNLLVPSFTATMSAVARMVVEPEIWDALLVSNQAMVLGFVIAVAIGMPAGLLLGRSKWAARIGTPYLNILLVSPTAVFIPLLIIWTGLGLTSRVILVVLIAVPYLIVNCRTGITQVNPQLIEMGRLFGAGEWTLWRTILIPAAVPQIMTGLRITLGRAIDGMVVVELIMVAVGLGNLVLDYQATFQPARLYAVVVFVIIEAVVLVQLLRLVERRATPWISRTTG